MDQIESSCVPPGFRFHPTEEELVDYYLKRKVNSLKIDLDVIIDVDLYNIEPWDIQDRCKLGYDEQNEWYFFSHKDRKYPTGTRTNRATTAGFWKATGRDKAVLSKERIIGMRKTLVFYKGRAPNGRKTDWIMHEYRLQTSEHGPPQEEGWVVCRAFKKPNPSHKQGFEAWTNNSNYYIRNSINNNYKPPSYPLINTQGSSFHHQPPFPSADQSTLRNSNSSFESQNMVDHLPKLDSPSISTSFTTNDTGNNFEEIEDDQKSNYTNYQLMSDWKSFDNLLATGGTPYACTATNMPLVPHNDDQFDAHENHLLECFHDL